MSQKGKDPIFLTLEEVYEIHRRVLEAHGGLDGVRDQGLLESAVESPKSTFYYGNPSLFDLAASYLFHIAENQPFVDGNKRTATASALVFLRVNGVSLKYDSMFPYRLCIAISEKKLSKQEVSFALEHGIFPE